jgi:hypothetical protein
MLLGANPNLPRFTYFHPVELYRFFKLEEHADALCRGHVYLGKLEACRRCEDPQRGDIGEGKTTYHSGVITGSHGDPHFDHVARQFGGLGFGSKNMTISNCRAVTELPDAWVLCLTMLPKSPDIETVGRYGVRIADPVLFFDRVTNALNHRIAMRVAAFGPISYASRDYGGLECALVRVLWSSQNATRISVKHGCSGTRCRLQ